MGTTRPNGSGDAAATQSGAQGDASAAPQARSIITEGILEAVRESWAHWRASQPLHEGQTGAYMPAHEWVAHATDGVLVKSKEIRFDEDNRDGEGSGNVILTLYKAPPRITLRCRWRARSTGTEISNVQLLSDETGAEREIPLEGDDATASTWLLRAYATRTDHTGEPAAS